MGGTKRGEMETLRLFREEQGWENREIWEYKGVLDVRQQDFVSRGICRCGLCEKIPGASSCRIEPGPDGSKICTLLANAEHISDV